MSMHQYCVAIVGSGPSGFFAAASLLKAADASDQIEVAVRALTEAVDEENRGLGANNCLAS